MKLEKSAYMLPVTTRTKKQRQGLNLYGHFIQMQMISEDGGLYTLKNRLTFQFRPAFFYKKGTSIGKGLRIQEKKV